MRFVAILPAFAVASQTGSFIRPHLKPLSLVELATDEDPAKLAAVKETAKKQFLSLMQEAEEKALHDPVVLKADEELRESEAKFKADSRKASDLLASIKTRFAQSKETVAAEEKHAAEESARMQAFTESENSKLEETEKKLMQLQQKKISSSFAELPVVTVSSLLENNADNARAQQEIHQAEKALSELSNKIKKRVDSLNKRLHTPGHQFAGEVVL